MGYASCYNVTPFGCVTFFSELLRAQIHKARGPIRFTNNSFYPLENRRLPLPKCHGSQTSSHLFTLFFGACVVSLVKNSFSGCQTLFAQLARNDTDFGHCLFSAGCIYPSLFCRWALHLISFCWRMVRSQVTWHGTGCVFTVSFTFIAHSGRL